MKPVVLLVAALVLLASVAKAQVPRGIRTCDASATALNFGVFTGQRIDTGSTITLTCNGNGNNNPVVITLSEGTSNTFLDRVMFNGFNELHYNLYIDAGHSMIWGSGAGETQAKLLVFDFRQIGNVTQSTTVFARVPIQVVPAAGHYSDQIFVTVIF